MSVQPSDIKEHMEVIDSKGESVGKVDHFQDGRIKLSKSNSPDGKHHFVPLTWIAHVDKHVHLKKSLADIKQASGA